MGVLLVFLVFWRRGHYIGSDQQGDNIYIAFIKLRRINPMGTFLHVTHVSSHDMTKIGLMILLAHLKICWHI